MRVVIADENPINEANVFYDKKKIDYNKIKR